MRALQSLLLLSLSRLLLSSVLDELGYLNVRSPPYSAKGDGTSDDTSAFQRALDDAEKLGGGIVFVPPGNYLIGSDLVIGKATVLKGSASHVQKQWGDPRNGTVVGSTLLAVANAGNESGTPFISLADHGSGIEGLQIFYPNQVTGRTPIAYPWTIRCGQSSRPIDNTFVKDVLLVNSWKGIDAGTYHSARHFFQNVYGQILSVGIVVDQCYDVGRISNIHFSPFWSGDPFLRDYIGSHAIAFLFLRSDWEIVENVFTIGYHIGMQFNRSASGGTNGQFTDINFDSADIGLDISYTQTYGILFTNLNIANTIYGQTHIGILGHSSNQTSHKDAIVQIRGASFWGHDKYNILWQHKGFLSISDSLFHFWNETGAAIQIESGRAMLSNNYFADSLGTGISLSASVEKATVTGNQLNNNSLQYTPRGSIVVANNLF